MTTRFNNSGSGTTWLTNLVAWVVVIAMGIGMLFVLVMLPKPILVLMFVAAAIQLPHLLRKGE